jgi:sec-independent protein translocase protein TatB
MFGLSWTEIGIIMAVALIFIGPKDMPVAIRTVTAMMKKARGMAAEFQTHVDDMMREANLSEVKTEFNKIRKFDFKSAVEKQIDPDGGLKNVMTQTAAAATAATATTVKAPVVEVEEPAPDSPPFIPPEAARSKRVPDFIPPGTKRWGY